MRDIYVCVIFLRVKIYWMFFYWSHFYDVHFSYSEVCMCQVLGDLASAWVSRGRISIIAHFGIFFRNIEICRSNVVVIICIQKKEKKIQKLNCLNLFSPNEIKVIT